MKTPTPAHQEPASMLDFHFHDLAAGFSNPAEAAAVAARRERAIAANLAWTVTFYSPTRNVHYWNGSRYDALAFAKDMVAHGEPVILEDHRGDRVDDIAGTKF